MAWFDAAGGTTCVVAYDAVGAVSLADSYVNEANPGTYDAAPGTAPTWAYGTGWTFDGTSQYLTTGYVPPSGQNRSMLVRFSGATTSGRVLAGALNVTNYIMLYPIVGTTTYYGNGVQKIGGSPAMSSGVLGVAGSVGYRDGSSETTGITDDASATSRPVYIGAYNSGGSPALRFPGNIQAVAIYSGTLSGADVATITTAMLALPTPAGQPTTLRHGATGRRLFGPRIGAGGW